MIDEVDLILDTCIAENKSWPNQVEKAITTIRRLTSQTQIDYFQCKREGQLGEWPQIEDLKQFTHPDDFKLKEIKFLGASKHCQDRYGCDRVRAGAVISNQVTESAILTPSCLNPMQDAEGPSQDVSLDFIY